MAARSTKRLPVLFILLALGGGLGTGLQSGQLEAWWDRFIAVYPSEKEVLQHVMARFDLDGDGSISESEYDQFASQHDPFSTVDVNGDDAVDIQELDRLIRFSEPGFRRMRQRGGPRLDADRP